MRSVKLLQATSSKYLGLENVGATSHESTQPRESVGGGRGSTARRNQEDLRRLLAIALQNFPFCGEPILSFMTRRKSALLGKFVGAAANLILKIEREHMRTRIGTRNLSPP